MDRGAWQVTVHAISKESDTTSQLKQQKCILTHVSGVICWARRLMR